METERQNDSWKLKDKMVVSWEEAGIIRGRQTNDFSCQNSANVR